MRKVILMMQVSLDGFIEGPGQDLGCHRVDDELHRHFIDELRSMGAFLDGRVTYQMMADYWPTADQNPSSTRWRPTLAAAFRRLGRIEEYRIYVHPVLKSRRFGNGVVLLKHSVEPEAGDAEGR